MERARQLAFRAAAARHARLHHMPDIEQASAHFSFGAPGQFVLEHQPGDGLARCFAHRQQIFAAAKRMRQLVMRREHLRIRRAGRHDKAAANRQIARLTQALTSGIEGMEFHTVRMLGHRLAAVESDVLLLRKAHRVTAQQRQRLRFTQFRQLAVDGVGVDGVRRLAHQAEDDTAIGTVALASGAEGAIQLHAHAGHLRHQPIGFESRGEHQRGAHRADGVRAGRADANLEEVENRNSHGVRLRGALGCKLAFGHLHWVMRTRC